MDTKTQIAVSQNTKVKVTLRLEWYPVPKTLPPDPVGGWFSPIVWLALSNGEVKPGSCLHRIAGAKYKGPVHSWFTEEEDGSTQLTGKVKVVAWMPFATPDHPFMVGGRILISKKRSTR